MTRSADIEGGSDPEPPKKKRRWRRLAIEIGVVLAVVLAFRAWQQRDAASGPAPALSGVAPDGASLALGEAPGEPVLVHFWATWCGVCRAEQGTIDGLAEDGHRVLSVASRSGRPADVAAYVDEHDLDFPVILDPDGRLARRWGVHAFPTSFVIGPDGTIRSTEVGYTTSAGFRARLWLAR
ncbi:MAG TPA: redoxin family protein [Sandaracinaceae bacterium LLY-WYZ-13_1]|nr:redoxin family protein [Sandaracinaceae bacterium LLY-WYZ-13_1]